MMPSRPPSETRTGGRQHALTWCLLAVAVALAPTGAQAQDAPAAAAPADATEPAATEAPGAAPPATETPVAEPPAPPPADDGPGFMTGPVRWIPYAQLKIRDELFSNYPFNVDNHDNRLVTRARFGMTAQWESLEIVIQMQDVRAWGGAPPGAVDGSSFAVIQGYAGVTGDMGFVRAGRQFVNYGDQRMIGALDWSMPGRAFDGLRFHGVSGDFELDLFGAVTQAQGTATDDATMTTRRTEGSYLATAYGTWHGSSAFNLDAYVLYRHDGGTNNALARDNNIFALGGRATGNFDIGDSQQLGYTVEVTGEIGSTAAAGSADFGAWAVSGDVRYSLGGSWKPRLRVGAAAGSGDDGDMNEFNNFFPTNHKFYGNMDLIGLRNVIEGHARFSLDVPDRPVNFYVEVLQLALQTSDGRWSNAGGATFAAAAPGASRNLGTELDFLVNYQPIPALKLQVGYSFFDPQSGAEDRGFTDLSHFAYLQLIVATP